MTFTPNGIPVVLRPDGMKMFASRGLSLVERFWEKVDKNGPIPEGREFLGPCWVWTGARSQSGYRNVEYGIINEGSLDGGNHRKAWRTNKLALLFTTGLTDVPPDPDELLIPWLRRASRFYHPMEASHRCDHSLCVRPDHLEWETHEQNLYNQRVRNERMKGIVEKGTV